MWIFGIILGVIVVIILSIDRDQKLKGQISSLPVVYKTNFDSFNPSVVNINSDPWYFYRISNFKWYNIAHTSYIYVLRPDGINTQIITDKRYEDPRPVLHGNLIYIISNVPEDNTNNMYLLTIQVDDLYKDQIPIQSVKLNPPFGKQAQQKNWMPFIHDDTLHFVYSVNPHIILKYHPEECILVSETSTFDAVDFYRGGSQVIEMFDHYLAVIHSRTGNFYMNYLYKFEKSPPFKVIRISKGFNFEKDSDVQFTAGLAYIKDRFYISYGKDDRESKVITLENLTV